MKAMIGALEFCKGNERSKISFTLRGSVWRRTNGFRLATAYIRLEIRAWNHGSNQHLGRAGAVRGKKYPSFKPELDKNRERTIWCGICKSGRMDLIVQEVPSDLITLNLMNLCVPFEKLKENSCCLWWSGWLESKGMWFRCFGSELPHKEGKQQRLGLGPCSSRRWQGGWVGKSHLMFLAKLAEVTPQRGTTGVSGHPAGMGSVCLSQPWGEGLGPSNTERNPSFLGVRCPGTGQTTRSCHFLACARPTTGTAAGGASLPPALRARGGKNPCTFSWIPLCCKPSCALWDNISLFLPKSAARITCNIQHITHIQCVHLYSFYTGWNPKVSCKRSVFLLMPLL